MGHLVAGSGGGCQTWVLSQAHGGQLADNFRSKKSNECKGFQHIEYKTQFHELIMIFRKIIVLSRGRGLGEEESEGGGQQE